MESVFLMLGGLLLTVLATGAVLITRRKRPDAR
jgi:LPXTG-motif cell wall-anchored protein